MKTAYVQDRSVSRPRTPSAVSAQILFAGVLRALRFLLERLLCSEPLREWLPVLALSRVHHEHNVRLLAFASRIKNFDF